MNYVCWIIMDFTAKLQFCLSAFLIYVLLITYGYCDSERNNLEVYKILNLKSSKFYPKVKIYFVFDEKSLENLERKMSLDDLKKALRAAPASEMDFVRDKVHTSKSGNVLKYQNRKKMEELIEFMRERYSSTNYFYSEMKRIQRQATIKDQMREMIDYCEKPENYMVKEKILSLFQKLKKKHDKELNLWNQPTNDLVINGLKDPYNDGV